MVFNLQGNIIEKDHIQKYVEPASLLDSIRNPVKRIKNNSNQWKALVLAFLTIGDYLAWKVSVGSQVRIGMDSIMGFSNTSSIPDALIQHLQGLVLCTLNQLADRNQFNIWQ